MEVSQFEKSITRLTQALDKNDNVKRQYEETYGLAIEMIHLYLKKSSGSPSEIDHLSLESMLRRAYAASLVSEELIVWKQFKECSDDLSIIRKFLDEARYLLKQLKDREKYLE